MKKLNQKGLANVPGYITVMLTIMILLFVYFILGTALQDSLTTNSTAYNATGNMITAGSNLTAQMPTAGTIIGVMVIVFVVVAAGFFGARKTGML